MTIVSISALVGAASEVCNREELDRLLAGAGEYDKDGYGEDAAEYTEQIELARALRVKQRREYRQRVAKRR